MKRRLLISIVLTFSFFCVLAQNGIKFKKYTNSTYRFSFDIPSHWAIKYKDSIDGVVCVPLTKAEKELYADCLEGIVFRLTFYKMGLDSALLGPDGNYEKVGRSYYTSDKTRLRFKVKNIKGVNWTGIYHLNMCGIFCKDNGEHTGECENIYFSNGSRTIHIETNGASLDDIVLKRLLRTIRFY
jgi:hypothetical protein